MRTGQKSGAWINSRQAQEVADFYVIGHSVKETAEAFGVSTGQVNNLARRRGLSNGRDGLGTSNERRTDQARRELVQRLTDAGFDVVALPSATGAGASFTIRCRRCGDEMTRTYDFLRRGNVICRTCEKRKTAERQEAKYKAEKAMADAKRLTNEILRLWYPPVDVRREALLSQTGVCEICGKPYTVRDYVQSCGLKYARDNGVCSQECARKKKRIQARNSNKRRGVQDSHRHRARKYGCEYDPSVKLDKLIERDGLRCALCGEMCDPNDHSWSKYAGPKYPSIDHIIPMSKGGGHTWDNVQVVHIICNSEKGDSFEEVGV